MTESFENKIVLIAGASRSIGRHSASTFAKKGACIINNNNVKKTKQAEEFVNEIKTLEHIT
jgi:NAD(P)-dependent dehydrogenase (short-subunit alcohol dehydrogenase family)